MATVTWTGGTTGVWSSGLSWSGFSVPTAADDVVIGVGDTVTVDAPAQVADITLLTGPPTAANLVVASSLALTGTLSGGVWLSGTLSGGTLDGPLIGQGGTLLGVTLTGSAASAPLGDLAIDAVTAASLVSPAAVRGTLTLDAGSYDATGFTLDPTAGVSTAVLAGGAGTVTLGAGVTVQLGAANVQHDVFPPPLGGAALSGDFVNLGSIGGDIGLTIGGAGFANQSTLSFVPIVVSETTVVALHTTTWSQSFGPTVDIASGAIRNSGLISLTGGTLTLGGASASNAGTIMLVDGTTQYFVNGGTLATAPLSTALLVGAASFDNTGTISADLIDFSGSLALAALGNVSGALRFDGTLDLGGGTLDASAYAGVTIGGLVENGTLRAGSGSLALAGATLDNVTLQPGGSLQVSGPIEWIGLPPGAAQVTLDAVTTEIAFASATSLAGVGITAGGSNVADTLALRNGVVTLGAASSLMLTAGALNVTGPGTLANDGSIGVAAGTLDIAALAGSGGVTVGAGATLEVGTLSGAETVTLDAGARLTIAALAGAPTIDYAGIALVVLPGTGALPVTLQNLTAGDLIDFTGVSGVPSPGFGAGGAAVAGGSLDVAGASGDQANVPLTTPSSNLAFSVTIDPSGGTLVTAAACYRAGTRIATARGEVPIERLRRGDLIRTASGRFAPALWLGRRRIDCRRHARPEAVWPVRVAAHAFAPGRPARDLFLSPDHAVFLDGALIPVRYLLNGASIAQRPAAQVEYWHVELPAHDVLLAENLPAESYLDTGNRAAFEGTRYRRPLPRIAALRLWQRHACAPLLAGGPALAAAHARLLARAQTLGQALTDAPALRVVTAAGQAAVPIGESRFRLPAGASSIRLLSRSFIPAHLAGPGGDARRLGVAVGALRLDGTALALDDPRFGAGWYAPEAGWRWTAGAAAIAAHGARELAIELAIAGRYWAGG